MNEINNAKEQLSQIMEGLRQRKDKSVQQFRENVADVHRTFDAVDGMSVEIQKANAAFRAWLGGASNQPETVEIEAQRLEPSSSEDA